MEPDRDERMPWSGHPAKTSESEGYAFNVARFYDHFLHNYRAHQGDDGSLQEILPPYWTFNSKDIIWPSVITVIPDWYYNFYGDLRPLADNYECMKRWVLFQQKAYQKPDYTIDYCNYGDWVDGSWIKDYLDKRTTSRPLMSTAYYYNNCRIVARAARLLGQGRRREAVRRPGRQGEGRLQRPVLRPEDEQVRERDAGIVRLPARLRPGARGSPRRGRRQPRRRDPGQAQGPHVGGPRRDAVVHAGADRRGPSRRGLHRRDADDAAELGLHGFQGGHDESGSAGTPTPRTAG